MKRLKLMVFNQITVNAINNAATIKGRDEKGPVEFTMTIDHLLAAAAEANRGRRSYLVPPGSLVLGLPGKVVRPVDEGLRTRSALTWRHYVAEAKRHQRVEFPRHDHTNTSM